MNRALYIIFIPALLVAAGYMLVFRKLGLSPGHAWWVIAGMAAFLVAGLWLVRQRGQEKTRQSGG